MKSDIKATLRDRGLRQKDVARHLSVSEATVCLWLSGQQRVPAERAKALAEMLGVEPGMIRPDLWPAPVAQAEAA